MMKANSIDQREILPFFPSVLKETKSQDLPFSNDFAQNNFTNSAKVQYFVICEFAMANSMNLFFLSLCQFRCNNDKNIFKNWLQFLQQPQMFPKAHWTLWWLDK